MQPEKILINQLWPVVSSGFNNGFILEVNLLQLLVMVCEILIHGNICPMGGMLTETIAGSQYLSISQSVADLCLRVIIHNGDLSLPSFLTTQIN